MACLTGSRRRPIASATIIPRIRNSARVQQHAYHASGPRATLSRAGLFPVSQFPAPYGRLGLGLAPRTDCEKEFLMRRVMFSSALVCFVLGAFAGSTAAQTFPYDHIHLNVPDPAAAANWYEKYFGGRRITEAPDRIMFGSTRLLVIRKADAKPSAGS